MKGIRAIEKVSLWTAITWCGWNNVCRGIWGKESQKDNWLNWKKIHLTVMMAKKQTKIHLKTMKMKSYLICWVQRLLSDRAPDTSPTPTPDRARPNWTSTNTTIFNTVNLILFEIIFSAEECNMQKSTGCWANHALRFTDTSLIQARDSKPRWRSQNMDHKRMAKKIRSLSISLLV